MRFFYDFFDCIFWILVNVSVSWIAGKRLNEYNLFIFRNGKYCIVDKIDKVNIYKGFVGWRK